MSEWTCKCEGYSRCHPMSVFKCPDCGSYQRIHPDDIIGNQELFNQWMKDLNEFTAGRKNEHDV